MNYNYKKNNKRKAFHGKTPPTMNHLVTVTHIQTKQYNFFWSKA